MRSEDIYWYDKNQNTFNRRADKETRSEFKKEEEIF